MWSRYETYLMIDPDDGSGDRVRARAIYVLAWSIALLQAINLVAITAFKSVFTVEAFVCLAVIAASVAAATSLRWRRDYRVYAIGAGLLGVGAPLATAVYDYTGINSALLPIMIATPMLVAFVGGPRLAVAAGLAGLAVVVVLYLVSANAPIAEAAFYAERNLQRAIHAASGIFLVTVMSAVVSANAFRTLRRLEERTARALRAEAAKTEFLAVMSHELRTPMNGVLGLADALVRDARDPDVREAADTIRRSGQSLMRILNDILDLSKIEAGRIDVVEEPFSPRVIVGDVAAQWRETAAQKGVFIESTIDAATPDYLSGDGLRIAQILSNLVSNAVKFTPKGRVAVTVAARPGEAGRVGLDVLVRDSGPGVPAEARERIFAPFEQAHGGVARSHGGTGLGLAISRRLAERMGGALTLEDAGPGAAFRFVASFPVSEAPAPARPAAGPSRPLSVLVVDDNAVNRLVAARLLRFIGHVAAFAESGPECLSLLSGEPFDVILMDKHMPGMSGLDAVARIRALGGAVAETPVVACTADVGADEQEAMREAGFDAFLAKPLSVENLSAALEAALRARMGAAA